MKGLPPEQGAQKQGCRGMKASQLLPCISSPLWIGKSPRRGKAKGPKRVVAAPCFQQDPQKHQHNSPSSEDRNAETHFVEGSTASQDDVRVLHLDRPLAQPHQVSPNPNCPTGHLREGTANEAMPLTSVLPHSPHPPKPLGKAVPQCCKIHILQLCSQREFWQLSICTHLDFT